MPATGRPWALVLLCSAAVLACAHCTTEQKYQVLSFLFDGVPDPRAKNVVIEDAGESEPELVVEPPKPVVAVFKHKPYEAALRERKGPEGCGVCHGRSTLGMRVMPKPRTLCRKCHTGFNEEAKYWHGPVAAWACGRCHSAHQSANKALLHKPAAELCATCHDVTAAIFISSNDAHASQEDCTRCHDPHGAADRFLLKF